MCLVFQVGTWVSFTLPGRGVHKHILPVFAQGYSAAVHKNY